jgi:hypothetical protein
LPLEAVLESGAEAFGGEGEFPFQVGIVAGSVGTAEEFPRCAEEHFGFGAGWAAEDFEASAQDAKEFFGCGGRGRGDFDAEVDAGRVEASLAHVFGSGKNPECLTGEAMVCAGL